MPKENDSTKPEGTEGEESEDEEAERLLAQAVNGKKPAADEDDEEEQEVEAEAEAGASDTVPRSEMLKAIKARQAAKKRLRELEEQIRQEKAKNESESERKIREAQEKTLKAATDKYKPALVKAGATAALLAAGPKKGKDGVPRLLKLMDLDAIDLTDDNDLEGVEEEVMRLQEEYPELFNDGDEETSKKDDEEVEPKKTPARRRTTSRSQDGAPKKEAEKKLSTSEIILKKMRGEL